MGRSWLVFIISLPTRNAAARMRVWRMLKALGCGVLRDGVYLLPKRTEFREALRLQAEDVIAAGGNAHVLVLDSENQEQQKAFEELFDRSVHYAKLIENIRRISEADCRLEDAMIIQKQAERLRRTYEEIAQFDFFPGKAREQALAALEDLELALDDRLAQDEPHALQRRIKRLQIQDYQGRLWATRQRPWIDRLASAWLIRRFIDPQARFIWLTKPGDCSSDALGFDFDGAAFTHIDAKVTFEVLLASFGLTQDKALARLGALVHYLDSGGIPVPEAAGLQTILQGMRQCYANDDDALLAAAEKIFDAFYQAFSGNDS